VVKVKNLSRATLVIIFSSIVYVHTQKKKHRKNKKKRKKEGKKRKEEIKRRKGQKTKNEMIPEGIEPSIFGTGIRRVAIAPWNHLLGFVSTNRTFWWNGRRCSE
jgi:glycyl-tRNA synthetase (class II)